MAEQEQAPRPLVAIEPRLQALIRTGQDLWQRPPMTENTVACGTCHADGAEIRGWAGSFPKVKPMPPPFTRVMTLHQVVSEALARHYRISPGQANRRLARAIAAYLAWRGEGRPVTPGVASGQPRFPARLAALEASVARGQQEVGQACGGCHTDLAGLAAVAATFPRVPPGGAEAVSLEEYLEGHAAIAWDSPQAADVAAFLASRAAGRLVQPGALSNPSGMQGG